MINKIDRYLFYIAYTLMLSRRLLMTIDVLAPFFKYTQPLCLVILGWIILSKLPKYDLKTLFGGILVGMIIFMNYTIAHKMFIVYIFLLVLAFKDMDFTEFIRYELILKILLMIIVFYMCYTGNIHNVVYYRGDHITQALGFSNPNGLGAYALSICCSYMYLRYKKIRFYDYLIVILVMYGVYEITYCRTAIIGIALLLISILMLQLYHKYNLHIPNLKKLLPLVPILIFVGFMFIFFQYGKSDFVYTIDYYLSERLKCGWEFYKVFGITLLGNDVSSVAKIYALDNAYLALLIRYGALILGLFLGLHCLGIKQILKEHNKSKEILIIIIIVYLIYGISETTLFKFYFNPFILFLSTFVFNQPISPKNN